MAQVKKLKRTPDFLAGAAFVSGDLRDLVPSYRESLRILRQGMRRAQTRSQSEPDPEARKQARGDLALMRNMEEDLLVVLAYLEGRRLPADDRMQVTVVDPRLLEAIAVAPAPTPQTKGRWELYDKVDDALARLDKQERDAVQMVVCGKLAYREAAKLLGCGPMTVHDRVGRGLAKLREIFRAQALAG